MAAGKINLQANDGKVAGVVFEDGASSNVTVTVPKDGGVVATEAYADTKVSKTGDETIGGVKSFTDGVKVQNQNVSPFSGFKNYIINGNFDVWQYGTSQTTSGYSSDDRWANYNNGSTKIHSREVCTDAERALFNANYFSRTVVTSVAGAGNFVSKTQTIEDVTKLAGKTVTISFWARASSTMNIQLNIAQFYGTGGSPSLKTHNPQTPLQITSTWQKKTITVTIPSIAGKILGTDGAHTSFTQLYFIFESGASWISGITIGQQSGTFDIAQVQLEEGSVATPFENRSYATELALCQRYFETGTINEGRYSTGPSAIRTGQILFAVPKRVIPTIAFTAISYINCSGLVIFYPNIKGFAHNVVNTTTGSAIVDANYTASAEL